MKPRKQLLLALFVRFRIFLFFNIGSGCFVDPYWELDGEFSYVKYVPSRGIFLCAGHIGYKEVSGRS